MNFLLPAVLGILFSAFTSRADGAPGAGASASNAPSKPLAELDKIEAADDAAQLQVDDWLRQDKQKRAGGGGRPDTELQKRITERFEAIRKAYADFVNRYPDDSRGRLAYGDFLNARQDELGAQKQWEQALQLDPSNAAIYNNLAGRYGESGPVNKAFEYSEKALELSPNEPVYYHNFADLLYVLRKSAAAHYGITEQQVYSRCLLLYSNALRLDPHNFLFARDLAQTYYSLKPLPTDAALHAWTNVLAIARDQDDRQEVYVHLARLDMLAGRFDQSRAQLNLVTNLASAVAKASLLKSIELQQAAPKPDAPNQPRK